ncbi:MAG: NYN domain-containing protein [Deltaproteobacteria bacterium]|nr:NYN domain-containing protein [Deltaproteobacteria bacterium]MBQ7249108.1 NYN domain-containing protein [Deltaproteobacteria bacterium]
MRTSVYIDGFNLYYRILKGTPYKWLDLKAMLVSLLPEHCQIDHIKYFTALVSGKRDAGQPIRQKTYIRALEKYIPELSVHYGRFLSNPVSACRYPLTNPPTFVNILKTEEKGSDVNLAVHLLNDAWHNKYDCAVLVSNDSDLAEALRLAREEQGKTIGLVSPVQKGQGHPSHTLQQYAHFTRQIREGLLAVSQLPTPIPNTTIHKPAGW